MFGRLLLRGVAAAVALGCLVAAAAARPQPRGTIDETTYNRLTRPGPFSTEIQGKANFRVPTGYRMVIEDKLAEFGDATGFPILGDESGYILLAGKPTWFGVILVVTDDPLKGVDTKNLNEPSVRAQLLDWERRFHEGRRPRKGTTAIPSSVAAWTHPPKYDEKAKVLTMGVRLEGEADGVKDKVNYQSFVYGPTGTIVLVSAFADVENYDKVEKESGKLAGEFTFIAPPEEKAGEEADDSLYMAKVGGGGVLGALAVLMAFKFFGGSRGRPAARAARRPPVRR